MGLKEELVVFPRPVCWVKGKVLAAQRVALKRHIIPKRNEKDLEEIPARIRAGLEFVTAAYLDDVLIAAFDGGFPVASLTQPHMVSKL